jgi:hypothetical protein
LPEKIERQATCFDSGPPVEGVFSLARIFRENETPDRDGAGAVSRLWNRTTLLYRTEAANAIGGFVDLPGRLGETIDWLARGRDLGSTGSGLMHRWRRTSGNLCWPPRRRARSIPARHRQCRHGMQRCPSRLWH